MRQCDFETFQEFFGVLIEWAGKKDEGGLLAQVYYELLEATNPTPDEVWAALSAHIDGQKPGMPSGRDVKEAIWATRRATQNALPPAIAKVELPREGHLTVLAAIFERQGDNDFYRRMLAGTDKVWSKVIDPRGAITHEEVLAFQEEF